MTPCTLQAAPPRPDTRRRVNTRLRRKVAGVANNTYSRGNARIWGNGVCAMPTLPYLQTKPPQEALALPASWAPSRLPSARPPRPTHPAPVLQAEHLAAGAAALHDRLQHRLAAEGAQRVRKRHLALCSGGGGGGGGWGAAACADMRVCETSIARPVCRHSCRTPCHAMAAHWGVRRDAAQACHCISDTSYWKLYAWPPSSQAKARPAAHAPRRCPPAAGGPRAAPHSAGCVPQGL